MKGDFTRSTFQPQKHYTSVRMQQGRLQLDADWNEQIDILAYLNQIQLQDMIGVSGVPETNGGFKIQTTDNQEELTISAGHIYVNGILCELEQEINYNQKPKADGESEYVVYLDVWQRFITAIDDPEIREIALVNVPDTATRTQTVFQVQLILEKEWEDFQKKHENRQLYLTANVKSISGLSSAIARDQGLGNHLYRIEIHKVDDNNQATFKWSRDNGSIVSAVTNIKENTIIIQNFGRDDLQSFAAGQWIEVTDEVRESENRPGTLVHLTSATSGRQLTFDPDTVDGDPITKDYFNFDKNKVKVRRWDNIGNSDQATIPINSAESITLEAGIEVQFNTENLYQTGDYWQLPVRSEQRIDQIPWSGKPQAAQGIKHHYCQLAKVTFNGTNFSRLEDKRPKFQSLTAQNNKLDISGGSITGSLGVGLDSKEKPQARLQVQGEQEQVIEDSTLFSKEDSPATIETQGLYIGQLKAGDIIIPTTTPGQPEQKIAIAKIDDASGILTVTPPLIPAIPQGTTFKYQLPTAIFTSNDGTAQLIINALGNVGIGTVAPNAKLEVAGISNFPTAIFTSNEGTPQLIINSVGNVGIGTVDPKAKLEVAGTVKITDNTTIDKNLTIGDSLDITNNLKVNNTIATALGNVGIGTVEPKAKLEVAGTVKITDNTTIDKNLNIGDSLDIANNLKVNNTIATALGNVGIGTVEPKAKLEVVGKVKITEDTTIDKSLTVTDTITTAKLNVTDTFEANTFIGDHLQIRGDSSIGGSLDIANNLTVNNTIITELGSVGIGTVEPKTKLEVVGTVKITDDTTINKNLTVNDTITTANLNVTGTFAADTFTGNRLQINGDSNISGSLTIARDLTVNGRFNTADLNINGALEVETFTANSFQIRGDGGIAGSLAIANDLNVTDKTKTANLEVTGTSQINNLQANNLQINRNVGIGVARPLARLHNQGAAPLPGQSQISSNGINVNSTGTSFNQYLNVGDIVTVTNGSTNQSRLITSIAANGTSLTVNAPFIPGLPATGVEFTYQQPITRLADSSGVTQFIITSTGNVGIGTSRPDLDTKLHIQGNVRVYGNLFQDSSRELKDNISEISQQEVYEILKGLNPVKYSYKNDTEQRWHLGFIAEQVPEVLASPDKTAVQPFNIVAVLAKAVKDQQAAIAKLTNLVEEQQKQIVALTQQTKSLEQKSWWG
ncbi:DUF6519 domain-containing protein [Calothrix sp. NIES-2098]|uniref:DUF6519 domain-containing protein n=1 Tax=Calothrix sp. NIES-2098 TaxID=1954171 RepID=UPI000B5EADF7|nr:hypothetical protein NIES2098_16990 [Calothrix sp. NIES-2098]